MENSPLANRIEAYFAALEAPLTELPTPRREEFLREARAHVHSMVEARRADGMSETAAWDSALRDFGDPQEVGRALWREWASSGQLESEGAPLSLRDLVRRYFLRLIWIIPLILLMGVLTGSVWSGHDVVPLFLIWFFGSFGWAFSGQRRDDGQLKPSAIISCLFVLLYCLNPLVHIVFRGTPDSAFIGHLTEQARPFLMCGLVALSLYFYKRDLPKRPWRFGPYAARYQQSPVAAEQEYRLRPLISIGIGVTFACIATLSMGLPLSHFPPALLLLIVVFVVSLVVEIWLRR